MNYSNDMLNIVVHGLGTAIAVGAVFSWAVNHGVGGSFVILLDPLAVLAGLLLDKSTVLLLTAVATIIALLRDSDF